MHIDDRLATVLRHRAASERAARTQYRQLLDLLNQRRQGEAGLEETGWQRLLDLSGQLPAAERARILREEGWRLRNLALILFLAEQEPDVAASALSTADLQPDEWLLLIPELPVRARGFLRLRRDLPDRVQAALDRLGVRDRGLPSPPHAPVEASQPPPEDTLVLDEAAIVPPAEQQEPAARPPITGSSKAGKKGKADAREQENEISALLRKIEAFQAARRAEEPGLNESSIGAADEPQSSATDHAVRTFDYAADASGRIVWAAHEVAPMVIGTSLHRLVRTEVIPPVGSPAYMLAHHLPVRGTEVELAGAPDIAGEWIMDAFPQFASGSGSFTGWLGRFRRPPAPAAQPRDKVREQAEALRQVLHELRTPINAIQGYAEFIQQQMIGPVPHAYRALAASISGDAASILSGFADLEQLARLQSGVANDAGEERAELASILAATVRQLRPVLQRQGSGFDLIIQSAESEIPLSQGDAEQLLWRLLAPIAASTGEREMLEVQLEQRGERLDLSCDLPAVLRPIDDLLAAELPVQSDLISPGLFGGGFALRLARAQARAIGGDLRFRAGKAVLDLPIAKADGGNGVAAA